MNFTLLSQGKVLTISRLDDTHAFIACDDKLDLYVKWWVMGKKNRRAYMTRQIRIIVGTLIEDGWDCVFVG